MTQDVEAPERQVSNFDRMTEAEAASVLDSKRTEEAPEVYSRRTEAEAVAAYEKARKRAAEASEQTIYVEFR